GNRLLLRAASEPKAIAADSLGRAALRAITWFVPSVRPALIGSVAPVRILVWRLAVALQDAGGFELGVGLLDPVELDGEGPIVAEVVGQLHCFSRLEGESSDRDLVGVGGVVHRGVMNRDLR